VGGVGHRCLDVSVVSVSLAGRAPSTAREGCASRVRTGPRCLRHAAEDAADPAVVTIVLAEEY
jgi:hypothetical protein